jgi:enamine deaminase RidA (YjgF/YER057c/UK114 family)
VTPARRAGDLVFVSGQAGTDPAGGDAVEKLAAALETAGASLDDVVDVISFHTDVREVDGVLERAERLKLFPALLAWTPLGTTGLVAQDARVSIRAIARVGGPDGRLVFTSSRHESDGPADPKSQVEAAYAQARAALEAAGGTMGDVIDICSFHLDPRGMIACEQFHNDYWSATPLAEAPAWTAIGAPALHRRGQRVQYRMIADLSEGKRIAKTPASLHWKHCPISGGTRKARGRLIGIAGEVASDAEGNITTPGDTASQARYAFSRIREVVELHGVDMNRVVEITAFHKDHRAWEIVTETAREFFDEDHPPAWTSVGMTGLWNPGYLHEIYALAVV